MMGWNDGGKERCVILGEYLIEHQATVRSTAKAFGISKSTVHKDVTVGLKNMDKGLYAAVRKLLEKNKEERHLRGGEATKRKYIRKKNAESATAKSVADGEKI